MHAPPDAWRRMQPHCRYNAAGGESSAAWQPNGRGGLAWQAQTATNPHNRMCERRLVRWLTNRAQSTAPERPI